MLKMAVMASLAATQAQASSQSCIARRDVADMVVVMLPYVIDSMRGRCASHLGDNAFLTQPAGATFAERLRAEGESRRAGAVRGLRMIGEEREPTGLSEDTVVRMMGESMSADLTRSINTAQCRDFDEMFDAMSSMNADQIGRLATALFSMSGVGRGRRRGPEICAA